MARQKMGMACTVLYGGAAVERSGDALAVKPILQALSRQSLAPYRTALKLSSSAVRKALYALIRLASSNKGTSLNADQSVVL